MISFSPGELIILSVLVKNELDSKKRYSAEFRTKLELLEERLDEARRGLTFIPDLREDSEKSGELGG